LAINNNHSSLYPDSYQAAKEKEIRACEQSDITTASEAENGAAASSGKGCRKKTPTRRYSQIPVSGDTSDEGHSSDSSVGMYGDSQEILPSIPIPAALNISNINSGSFYIKPDATTYKN